MEREPETASQLASALERILNEASPEETPTNAPVRVKAENGLEVVLVRRDSVNAFLSRNELVSKVVRGRDTALAALVAIVINYATTDNFELSRVSEFSLILSGICIGVVLMTSVLNHTLRRDLNEARSALLDD